MDEWQTTDCRLNLLNEFCYFGKFMLWKFRTKNFYSLLLPLILFPKIFSLVMMENEVLFRFFDPFLEKTEEWKKEIFLAPSLFHR